MKRSDFDEILARHLREQGRECCAERDVFLFALESIENAAALAHYVQNTRNVMNCPDYEKYEQVACNVQNIMDELP